MQYFLASPGYSSKALESIDDGCFPVSDYQIEDAAQDQIGCIVCSEGQRDRLKL